MPTFSCVNTGNEKFRNEMTIALAEKASQFQQQVRHDMFPIDFHKKVDDRWTMKIFDWFEWNPIKF